MTSFDWDVCVGLGGWLWRSALRGAPLAQSQNNEGGSMWWRLTNAERSPSERNA